MARIRSVNLRSTLPVQQMENQSLEREIKKYGQNMLENLIRKRSCVFIAKRHLVIHMDDFIRHQRPIDSKLLHVRRKKQRKINY